MAAQHETPLPDDETAGPFLYFAYGSNLDIERLHENCPSAVLAGIGRLPDYRLAFTRYSRGVRWGGSGVADIVPSPGDEVWGAIWEIATEHSERLDRQEAVFATPPGYRRALVDIATEEEGTVRCRTYQVVAPDLAGHAPSRAYLDTMLRGARAIGLPGRYVAQLEAIEHDGAAGGDPT